MSSADLYRECLLQISKKGVYYEYLSILSTVNIYREFQLCIPIENSYWRSLWLKQPKWKIWKIIPRKGSKFWHKTVILLFDKKKLFFESFSLKSFPAFSNIFCGHQLQPQCTWENILNVQCSGIWNRNIKCTLRVFT